jgi:hypothetical protein
MINETKRYWFPAKRYGWGWGPPSTWEGWLVLVNWFALIVPMAPWLARRSLPLFFLFIIMMSAILIAIAWATGEPPGWRPLPRYGAVVLSLLVAVSVVMLGLALYLLR